MQLNDGNQDAYTRVNTVTFKEKENQLIDIELKYLFAKLRIVTTDWGSANIANKPDMVKIIYYEGKWFNNYNVVIGDSGSDDPLSAGRG